MRRPKGEEEIEYVLVAHSSETGRIVMDIDGQVEAVAEVAEQFMHRGIIESRQRRGAKRTRLVFPGRLDEHMKMFEKIRLAAWAVIDKKTIK